LVSVAVAKVLPLREIAVAWSSLKLVTVRLGFENPTGRLNDAS
jgi:hypothetical protein